MENILEKEIIENKVEVTHWHYPEFKYMTNEEIVKHIQDTDEQYYWDELDKRTQELYSSVMRDKVHPYYKENMKEDMLTVLKLG